MDFNIKDIAIKELTESRFLKPFKLEFTRNNKRFSWDCLKTYDSVCIFLYHKGKQSFLLVKQFRAPVWYRLKKESIKADEIGATYELCAGLMDKNLSEKQTAIEEVLEETGFEVKDIEKIGTFYGDFGLSAKKQTLFFATIDDSMKKTKGGGVEDEEIELFYLPIKEAIKFIEDENIVKAASLGYCFYWFFDKFKVNF